MQAINERELIYMAIEEFYFKGRTNEQIAKVLHLPIDFVEQEIYYVRSSNKNISPPSMYGV